MANFGFVFNHNVLVDGALYAHISAKANAAQANVYIYPDQDFDPEMDEVGDVKRSLTQLDNEVMHLIVVGHRVSVVEGACDREYLHDLVESRTKAAERRGYRKCARDYRRAAKRVKQERETLADTLGEDTLAKLRALVV